MKADRILEIRKQSGCSIFEASLRAQKEEYITMLEKAKTLEDIKPILRKLIQRMT